jgi:hypothetical protein
MKTTQRAISGPCFGDPNGRWWVKAVNGQLWYFANEALAKDYAASDRANMSSEAFRLREEADKGISRPETTITGRPA